MAEESCSRPGKSKDFILWASREMGWGDLHGENIMDIGCGKGTNSTHFITELFPEVKEVIAIDKDPECIDVAQYESKHPKVKYSVADIADRSSLTAWEGKVSKVITHYCFNCVDDQKAAFENLYQLLTPGGDAAVLFTLESEYFSWVPEIVARWKDFAEEFTETRPPRSQLLSLKAPYYTQVLKDIGFLVLKCEDFGKRHDFNSDYACGSHLVSMLPFASRIPRHRKSEFAEDVLRTYAKYSERDENGQMCIRCRHLRALIRKPGVNTMQGSPRKLSVHASDAVYLFNIIREKSGWDDLSKDVVMDIGLGYERNCCYTLVDTFPMVQQVISIDKNEDFIEIGKQRFPHPKVHYEVGDIRDSDSVSPWYGQIDKVVSCNCYNCMNDQHLAFENTFRLLKPGGEGAILFNIQSGYFDWYLEIAKNPKWEQYRVMEIEPFIPQSHTRNYSDEYYRMLLMESGFEVTYCKEQERTFSYSSDESCIRSAFNSCTFSENIPMRLIEDFKEDLMEAFLKHNPRDSKGHPCLKYNSLTALIRKPK